MIRVSDREHPCGRGGFPAIPDSVPAAAGSTGIGSACASLCSEPLPPNDSENAQPLPGLRDRKSFTSQQQVLWSAWQEFAVTGGVAVALCLLATVLPSLYAAGIRPAEGFREQ